MIEQAPRLKEVETIEIREKKKKTDALLDQHQCMEFKVSIDQEIEQAENPEESVAKNGMPKRKPSRRNKGQS